MKFNNILFIEDNKTKFENISEFILKEFENVNIIQKDSFSSGLREIISNNYDLLLLDMSLPVRDEIHSANNYMQLGGHKILNELKRKKINIKTILVTMYSEFSTGNDLIGIEEIDLILNEQFKDIYIDFVYYSSHREDWKTKLLNILTK
ncbi:hypothetical protein N0B40_16685 [Chryseobacterium oranimense]|uniref:hypothetical protein n=1 Tax=Chryseobacterium oranimense TaxID=421058 RepID=UPI0021AFB3A3|nr:hypothetical protein [Chryseobacterium oranimense]UWX60030.1 hypothetical protein N0B40_16685 [Chryseobacterium oranimense]